MREVEVKRFPRWQDPKIQRLHVFTYRDASRLYRLHRACRHVCDLYRICDTIHNQALLQRFPALRNLSLKALPAFCLTYCVKFRNQRASSPVQKNLKLGTSKFSEPLEAPYVRVRCLLRLVRAQVARYSKQRTDVRADPNDLDWYRLDKTSD